MKDLTQIIWNLALVALTTLSPNLALSQNETQAPLKAIRLHSPALLYQKGFESLLQIQSVIGLEKKIIETQRLKKESFDKKFYQGGTGVDGGGGDSDAVDVLMSIKALSQWLSKSHIGLSDGEKKAIVYVTQKISKDMDDPSKTPIRMVDFSLKDASGTAKMALFSKEPFSIRVQRKNWKYLDEKDKFTLIGLELFGLAGVPDRYNLAGNIAKQISAISTIRGDLQLFNFIVGPWKVAGGACLSGMPVNWGSEPSEVANYEVHFKFNMDSSAESDLLYKGSLKVKSKEHFSIQKANLIFNTLETCQYEPGQQVCESDLMTESNFMLSIQGDQLWLLSNQGPLGGSCGIQDIFVMKLNRQ